MPRLAPDGKFPELRGLTARALLGLLDGEEIRAEIGRQLDRFEAGMRAPAGPHRRAPARACALGRAAGAAGDGAAALSEPARR